MLYWIYIYCGYSPPSSSSVFILWTAYMHTDVQQRMLLLFEPFKICIQNVEDIEQNQSSRPLLLSLCTAAISPSGWFACFTAQNPLSGERRKTLSITHHALSPPPSHHHLYIIHLINWLQRFYRITMSLKRPFVPKSDVKQRFTTTTTCLSYLVLVNAMDNGALAI